MAILIYSENVEGAFKKAVLELASYAYALGQKIGTEIHAVTIGTPDNAELQKLSQYGVRFIHTIADGRLADFNPQAYAASIVQIAEKTGAQIILFQNNYNGMAIAPRVAAKLDAGMVSSVIAQPASLSPFVVRRKVYSGKAFAQVEIQSERKVLALAQNSYGLAENKVEATIEAFSPQLPDRYFALKVESVTRTKGKVPVTEAELIVSGGRGLKGPENWYLVEDLAKLIGASTACSKPVADIEWRPHEEHVGQTGKFISPNLYIAIGISGAIQHLAGISSSKVIVAINIDPEAPFFEAADYGIVGDAFQVVPKLTEAIRKIKNG
jgi:electron transfer flavoprotein alpha subunit